MSHIWDLVIQRFREELKSIKERIPKIEVSSDFISLSMKLDYDFIELLQIIDVYPRYFLMDKNYKFSSFDELFVIQAEGDSRFDNIELAMEKYNKKIKIIGGHSLHYAGGFSFYPDLVGKDWNEFGQAKFTMGRFQIIEKNHQVSLILNVAGDSNPTAMIKLLIDEIISNLNYYPETFNIVKEEEVPAKKDWMQQVKKSLSIIKMGDLQKVVMARSLEISYSGYLGLSVFLNLLKNNHKCYVFHFEPQKNVVFVGATPELLLETDGRRFQTMALAGTMKRGGDNNEENALEDSLTTSSKIAEEHEIVVNNIAQSFGNNASDIEYDAKPKVYKLRRVQHLITHITGIMKSSIFSFVSLLHPTPAVGGYPREMALNIIKKELERGWYAAPLGIVNTEGGGKMVVGLRSALIRDGTIHAYAGAGIVEHSDPEHEWKEIDLKFKPILEAINE